MKLLPPSQFPPLASQSKTRRRSGMALIIVLGMLTLVLILVVAFFSSASVELQSAKRYSSGTDARALADSAVSVVISQIQDATAKPKLAWASQPGMIRTYDDKGQAEQAFKLYSSNPLRVDGTFGSALQDAEVPPEWMNSPALFTDLNKPVAAGGVNHYPIINPSAVAKDNSGGAALIPGSSPIEGCYLDTSNPAVVTSATQSNLVPMPVQWMYVLKSGSLAAMDPSTNKISGASKTNPIVGRVAFWTDDETSKVNINTASEGVFWDRPWTSGSSPSSSAVADGAYERNLAVTVPVQNEFQRYPGHPAMTSLSTVFPSFAGSVAARERIYDIIPRVTGGGSLGGTQVVNQNSAPIVPDNHRLFASMDEFFFTAKTMSAGVRQSNVDGSGNAFQVDDIERTRFFLTANSRAPEVNLFNKPRVTLWPLQANTASVSDPDGAIERNSKDRLIAFCSTIGKTPYYFQRYNTYTAANPSSQSPRMDWDEIPRNQELYAYLQALTNHAIPGLGGSLGQKYPGTRDQILTQMFDYIRSGVNTFSTGEAPNYFYTPFNKANFVTGQGQVVPLYLPNGTKGFGRFPTLTEVALLLYNKDPLTISGTIPVGGVIMAGTNVLASFPSGAVLNEYPINDLPTGNTIRISGTSISFNPPLNQPRNIGAALILEPFNPTPGAPPWTSNVRYAVHGLDGLGVGFSDSLIVNRVTSIDSTLNSTAHTGMEANFQQPVRKPKTLGSTNTDSPDPAIYPFIGSFTASGTTMDFTGGTIRIDIYQGASRPLVTADMVQNLQMTFPPVKGLPLPLYANQTVSSGTTTISVYSRKHKSFTDFYGRISHIANSANIGGSRWGVAEDNAHNPLPLFSAASVSTTLMLGDTVRSVEARYGGPARGDYRMIAGLNNVPENFFEGHGVTFATLGHDPVLGGNLYLTGTTSLSRLVHSVSNDNFPGSGDTSATNGFYLGAGGANDPRGKLVAAVSYSDPNRGNTARNSTRPVAPRGLQGATMVGGEPGDWDTGPGATADGPYINPPDQASANKSQSGALHYEKGGYINSAGIVESGASFSPNRQISSAVAFGSLPTGIDPSNTIAMRPWQTLLFGKQPAAGSRHPGFGTPLSGPPYTTPPDHAFLDLFTMPIVEPYAISEPFSTAGKVNMNYQIMPFTYLKRSTGVRSVLKATNMMAIATTSGSSYKISNSNPPNSRYTLNLEERAGTLKGFEDRFARGDIFRSTSEICDISLVPKMRVDGTAPAGNPTYDTMEFWWRGNSDTTADGYKLTGDNVREQPYGHIYPRLTTKSNTYTVHVQTQSIVKAGNVDADTFVEGRDQVTGEFRGSFLIERFLDPNADSLVKVDDEGRIDPNATKPDEKDLNTVVGPYKFRVVSSKKFAP